MLLLPFAFLKILRLAVPHKHRLLKQRSVTASCFLSIMLAILQGCVGAWPLIEQPPQATNTTNPAVMVTPTSHRATKSPSTTHSGLPSELPILLSVPAATLRTYPPTATIAPLPTKSQAEVPPQPLPSSVLIGSATNPPADFFVPAGVFSKPVNAPKQSTTPTNATATTPPPTGTGAVATAVVPQISAASAVLMTKTKAPEVLLYASPATRAYFSAGGIDAKINIQTWEGFLRKYEIPFKVTASVELLEKMQSGVLLLPSTVALSERERQAVIGFRAKGGAVLASWLTGVRNEYGEWRGFGFMENALDTKVAGNTEADEEDTFMMPHGDSPVTHRVPAGSRIWMERVKEWYPLRLAGRHPAAQVMDWSRTVVDGKPSATIVFDERDQSSGKPSRSVVLGYPERLWLSADAKALESIAHDALMWLLRQPDAYTSAWPYPYASAFVLAIDAADTMADADLNYAKLVEDSGGRATYYVLSEQAAKSVQILKSIQARGHEIAYLGDRFDGFQDQSSDVQSKRLDTMLSEMKGSGIELAADAGFHAPMESYDKTTEKLLKEHAFGHYVASPEASEARLPFFASIDAGVSAAKPARALVVLPRTQNGPEDLMAEGDPASALKTFLNELNLAEQMSGLSVVRIPSQGLLTDVQLAEISKHLKARHDRMWLATAGQVAEWWRERERVSTSLDSSVVPPLLKVTIKGDKPLQQPVAVWINLPESGSTLRLTADDSHELPKIASVDAWRATVTLKGLAPGEYHWHLYFDHSATRDTK